MSLARVLSHELSSEHSLSSLSSSTSINNEPEPLNEDLNPSKLTSGSPSIRSRRQLQHSRSNQSLITDDLNRQLRKQLTIDDGLLLRESSNIDRSSINRDDIENNFPSQDDLQRTKSEVERIYTNKSTGELDLPPDGGYGWVCVACAFVIQFSTWGNNSGFGVFLSFYINNDTFPGATNLDFAWIAGLIVFNAQFFAPFALIAVKFFGFKTTMAVACAVHFVGYILASFSTKLWQLFVCQGVIVGVSYSFLFVPNGTIIPNWFLKKRGLASGILYAGTGLGGVFYSLTINAMIKTTGNQRWALRMIAIISTFSMAIAITFIKRRNDPPRTKINWVNIKKITSNMFDIEVIKTPRLGYITMWFSLTIFGYNLILFSFASYATSLGISQHNASTLTALINVGQTFGRPHIGLVADLFIGRINYTLILNILLTILTLAFWINAKTMISLIFCSLIIGFTLGVGNVMNSVLIADSFSPESFPCAWSFLNMIMAFFCLFVEVIALALRDQSLPNPFIWAQVFAGLVFFVSFCFLAPLRQWKIKRVLIEKRESCLHEGKSDKRKQTLQVDEKDCGEPVENYQSKLEKYDKLLESTPTGYIKRLFYPMKV